MSKSVLAAIVALLIIVGGVGFMLTRPKSQPANNTTTTSSTPATTDNTSNTTQQQSTTPNTNTNESNSVTIQDMAYSPATLTVKAGTKVTWINQDSVKHDITPDKTSSDFMGSSLLAKGESYSFTFNKTGTFTYHCSIHLNMKATVVVTE